MTSHDVVDRVRRILRERSVGHLGTLDPMATGVLPLLVGRYTRLAQFFDKADKAYEGEFAWVFLPTPTMRPVSEAASLNRSSFTGAGSEAAKRFVGKNDQMPPPFLPRRSPASQPKVGAQGPVAGAEGGSGRG